MQLPFTVEVEPPSLPDLSRLARNRWTWIVLFGLLAALTGAYLLVDKSARAEQSAATATLLVTSVPEGAEVEVDGRGRGLTPTSLGLPPGGHEIRLRLADYADSTYHVDLADAQSMTLVGELWLRTPLAQRLRPTYPGASIVGASFLSDGRVALTVALPPGEERQLWLVDGRGGVLRVGPPEVRGALALSPDGKSLAYLAQSKVDDPVSGRLDEVWLAGATSGRGQRRYALPPSSGERLQDLSWAPGGDRLLLVSRLQPASGAVRTRLLRLDRANGGPSELTTLPSEVVPGSFAWSPDGERVAFLTRAGSLTSLCLVSLDGTEFRYLADLGRDDASPLAFPPIAWSADASHVVYAAPTQERLGPGGFLFGAKPALSLFSVELPRSQAKKLSAAEGQSPTFRADGTLVALTHPKGDGPLVLRAFDAAGRTRDLGELPVKASAAYATRWDPIHAQALIAVRAVGELGTPQTDYWLARYRPEVQQ